MVISTAACSEPQHRVCDTSASDEVAEDSGAADTVPDDLSRDGLEAAIGTACDDHADCERGLWCTLGECRWTPGCADDYTSTFDFLGAGCLVDRTTAARGGWISARECETDADCASRGPGAYCILWVCSDLASCMSDADCPDGHACLINTVCVPAEAP